MPTYLEAISALNFGIWRGNFSRATRRFGNESRGDSGLWLDPAPATVAENVAYATMDGRRQPSGSGKGCASVTVAIDPLYLSCSESHNSAINSIKC